MQIEGKNGVIFNAQVQQKNNEYDVKIQAPNGETMGRIAFVVNKGTTFILHISTEEKFQHQGVGQALIDICEYISALQRSFHIEGYYFPTNEYAQLFYQKNNYIIEKDSYNSYVYKIIDVDKTRQRLKNRIVKEDSLSV